MHQLTKEVHQVSTSVSNGHTLKKEMPDTEVKISPD